MNIKGIKASIKMRKLIRRKATASALLTASLIEAVGRREEYGLPVLVGANRYTV